MRALSKGEPCYTYSSKPWSRSVPKLQKKKRNCRLRKLSRPNEIFWMKWKDTWDSFPSRLPTVHPFPELGESRGTELCRLLLQSFTVSRNVFMRIIKMNINLKYIKIWTHRNFRYWYIQALKKKKTDPSTLYLQEISRRSKPLVRCKNHLDWQTE